MAFPSQENVHCFLCQAVISTLSHITRHFRRNHLDKNPKEVGNWLRVSALKSGNIMAMLQLSIVSNTRQNVEPEISNSKRLRLISPETMTSEFNSLLVAIQKCQAL